MRYICHSNGCDLLFASIKEKLPTQLFKAMISRYVFDSDIPIKVERDHNQPLNIYSASDNFLHIGEPEVIIIIYEYLFLNIQGAAMRGKVSFEKLWQESVEA